MEEIFLKRGERFKEVYEYLCSIGRIEKQKELAQIIGCTESQLSKAFRGHKSHMTENLIRKVNSKFDNLFNENYILNGDGTLLRQQDPMEAKALERTDMEKDSLTAVVEVLVSQLSEKDNTISFLRRQIEIKDKQIIEKDKTIAFMRDLLQSRTKEDSLSKKDTAGVGL